MSIVNKWAHPSMSDRPPHKEWVGAAITAAGMIGSALISKKSSDKAIDAQKDAIENQPSEHEILNQMSGGKYGDYLKNYAYASPEDQGKMARGYMESAYPELNAWEMAGSSSAGVAGAMGSDANDVANSGAQIAAADRRARLQAATQLEQTKIQANTQLQQAVIQAGTSAFNTKQQTDTQKLGIQTQADTARESQNIDIARMKQMQPKIDAEVKNIAANTKLTAGNINKVSYETVKVLNETLGIKINNDQQEVQLQIMEATVKERIQQAKYGTSQSGKMIVDTKQILVDAYEKSLEYLDRFKGFGREFRTKDPFAPMSDNPLSDIEGIQGTGMPLGNDTKAYIRSLQ